MQSFKYILEAKRDSEEQLGNKTLLLLILIRHQFDSWVNNWFQVTYQCQLAYTAFMRGADAQPNTI